MTTTRPSLLSLLSRNVRRTRRLWTGVRQLSAILWTLASAWWLRSRSQTPFDETTVRGLLPVRGYWDRFLKSHRDDIRGVALEIGNTDLTRGIGGAAVTRADALDVAPAPGIAIVADLQRAWDVPGETYDVFVNQFTMHLLPDDRAALFHAVRLLKPGGVLLCNFPCVSSYPLPLEYSPGTRTFVERWYTPAGVRRLVDELGLGSVTEIVTYGSPIVLLAYLCGLPLQRATSRWLDYNDPSVPILVCVRIQRPENWNPPWQPPRASATT